jgi:hypothetical protein
VEKSIEERMEFLEKNIISLTNINTGLAEEIKGMQKAMNEQNYKVEKLQVARECENIINKLEHYLEAGRFKDVANLFALKTPGVRVEEFGNDGYEGGEAVLKRWTSGHASGWRPGFMCINTTSTTVVEVAEDCLTARIAFISPGVETSEWQGKWQAYWIWAKLGIDFVKEDGCWKIWHYHVYGLFCTQYEKPWTDLKQTAPMLIPYEELEKLTSEAGAVLIKPNTKATHPGWWWRPDVYNDPVPAPPEHYQTFDIGNTY